MSNVTGSTIVLCAVILLASPVRAGEEVISVQVVNLPPVQEISGAIEVAQPIPHARMIRIQDVVVSPQTPRDNTNRLVSAGTVDAAGFTRAMLTVGGDVKGTVPATAELGALLVPDETFVDDAFQRGYILFPIEVTAAVPANAAPSVGSDPKEIDLAFPRYKVYLFNTSSRAISAQVYVLLTH